MRSDWHIDSDRAIQTIQLLLEHVLVWYDEPQVITAIGPKNSRYIGVAVDDSDDSEVVRWIYSPITPLEFHALICGATTVRDAIASDNVIVADRRVDGGAFDRMWMVSDRDIPESFLPTKDSFLDLGAIVSPIQSLLHALGIMR